MVALDTQAESAKPEAAMLKIDLSDGTVIIPCHGEDVLQCSEISHQVHGRLLLQIPREAMDTTDISIGCMVLGDWRQTGGHDD